MNGAGFYGPRPAEAWPWLVGTGSTGGPQPTGRVASQESLGPNHNECLKGGWRGAEKRKVETVGRTQGAAGLSEELRRERLLDLEDRMAPFRRRAFAVLGISLLIAGPWEGWWWLIPLAAALAAFAFVDRKIGDSPHPERWMGAGWAVSPLMIAISVALTGAYGSPATAWFALPAITLGMRFERRGVTIGAIYLFVLMFLSVYLADPGAVAADPTKLVFTGGLTIATLLLSGAVVQSDREHRKISVVDPLTGLFNRAALAQKVDELRPLRNEDRCLGLLIGDLDHFKRINDEHGHATGDAVLRDVAYAIAGALRSFDVAYRIGGEEFLVMLPDADSSGVEMVAERLRSEVGSCSRPGISVSMSFGGVSGAYNAADFGALSAAADKALYEAKRAGRDRVVMVNELKVTKGDPQTQQTFTPTVQPV
jgi:diguanylate cyclase (GGDEF)-like protein